MKSIAKFLLAGLAATALSGCGLSAEQVLGGLVVGAAGAAGAVAIDKDIDKPKPPPNTVTSQTTVFFSITVTSDVPSITISVIRLPQPTTTLTLTLTRVDDPPTLGAVSPLPQSVIQGAVAVDGYLPRGEFFFVTATISTSATNLVMTTETPDYRAPYATVAMTITTVTPAVPGCPCTTDVTIYGPLSYIENRLTRTPITVRTSVFGGAITTERVTSTVLFHASRTVTTAISIAAVNRVVTNSVFLDIGESLINVGALINVYSGASRENDRVNSAERHYLMLNHASPLGVAEYRVMRNPAEGGFNPASAPTFFTYGFPASIRAAFVQSEETLGSQAFGHGVGDQDQHYTLTLGHNNVATLSYVGNELRLGTSATMSLAPAVNPLAYFDTNAAAATARYSHFLYAEYAALYIDFRALSLASTVVTVGGSEQTVQFADVTMRSYSGGVLTDFNDLPNFTTLTYELNAMGYYNEYADKSRGQLLFGGGTLRANFVSNVMEMDLQMKNQSGENFVSLSSIQMTLHREFASDNSRQFGVRNQFQCVVSPDMPDDSCGGAVRFQAPYGGSLIVPATEDLPIAVSNTIFDRGDQGLLVTASTALSCWRGGEWYCSYRPPESQAKKDFCQADASRPECAPAAPRETGTLMSGQTLTAEDIASGDWTNKMAPTESGGRLLPSIDDVSELARDSELDFHVSGSFYGPEAEETAGGLILRSTEASMEIGFIGKKNPESAAGSGSSTGIEAAPAEAAPALAPAPAPAPADGVSAPAPGAAE